MTSNTSSPTIILIAGHWLGAWAWDEVLEQLNTDHSRAIAITLPGLDGDDPERAEKTLDDQAAAILDGLTRLRVPGDQPAIVVAHSGANAPVSLVLDRHPELVHRVVWVWRRVVSFWSACTSALSAVWRGPSAPFETATITNDTQTSAIAFLGTM